MNIRNTCLSLLLAAPLLSQSASAALAVTDGAFNNGNTGSLTNWFESGSTGFVEGAWLNSASYPITFTSGNMLIMDGLGDNSYIYQSLGTVDLADIANGVLRLTADFGEKSDANSQTNTAAFQIFAGSFAPAADGVDIFGHASQPTLLATFVLDAVAQGLTPAGGNQGRANGVLIGNVDLTSVANGTQLWLRVVDAADGTDNSGTAGDFLMDNITATVVPEPSVALLGGLGVLALLRRRRNG